MGVVEDVRKVLQDFLSPELREQKARLDALDQQVKDVKETLKEMRAESKANFFRLEQKVYESNRDLIAEMKLGFREVRSDMRLSERVEKIEKTMSAEQQH